MTSDQAVEMLLVAYNGSFQNYPHAEDHSRRATGIPRFKPFTKVMLSLTVIFKGFFTSKISVRKSNVTEFLAFLLVLFLSVIVSNTSAI